MATVIRTILKGYRYLNNEVSDPRTHDLFLVTTPWPGLAILAFYLYFTFNLGPKIMANRRPFKLDRVLQIYNVIQIIACGYLVYKAITLAFLQGYNLRCQPIDFSNSPRAVEIAEAVWFYFMLKVFDLLDTVFFVLRKKQNQVSFLHVYHHTGMVMGSWAAVKWLPGGHVVFLGLVNSFVHVIMYSHYLIMSFKIWKPWWKRYITQLQLAQFIILLYHFGQLLWVENCGFPIWPTAVFIPQNLFMIVLFSDFYYKTYIKKQSKRVEQNGTIAETLNGKVKSH